MRAPMDWDDLHREAGALRDERSGTASGLAASGAQLLHRALSEMYIGEPEPLREIAFTIAEARPEVVAIRNVGVSAYRTAREARSGDRMAAAARSVARLARLLGDTPASLARRGQPLLPENATVVTMGRSESVRAAIALARDRITELRGVETANQTHHSRESGNPSLHSSSDDVEMALDGADIVLLGCTAFLAEGSMAADVGTLALVEAAAHRDPVVPVHFFADTLKLAPWLPARSNGQAPLELDIIPPKYVDHVITEDGIRRPGQLLQAAADLATWWRMLETPEGLGG